VGIHDQPRCSGRSPAAFQSKRLDRGSENDPPYEIRHVGFAAFLRYCLEDEAHVATDRKGTGYLFSFYDPEYKAREFQTAFFSEEGAGVGNARTLLDCSRDISHSIIHAKQFGKWERNEQF
jgi:hypothetical protein